MNYYNLLIMVVVGIIAGSLAARIVKGDNFGPLINGLLGIAGAIVGGFLFKLVGLTPGQGIVNIISDTFGVELPKDFVGMLVSATIGASIILFLSRFVKRDGKDLLER
jgi:uncharacterized membrane protein YeaQ/YmgE (transglycosylase-associated protein family)